MTQTQTLRRWRRIGAAATLAGLTVASLMMVAPAAAHAAPGNVTVVDGDTLVIDGEKIRIQGIDTPERGEACHREAANKLRRIVASGDVTVTNRDGTDRYGRTIASVSVDGTDIGLLMLRAGVAVARYDSRDGYGSHPQEGRYHAAERNASCTEPALAPEPGQQQPVAAAEQVAAEQGEATEPFWTWAALGALAAGNGIDLKIGSFTDDDGDSNVARAAAALWIATAPDRAAAAEKAAAEAQWYAAAAEAERKAAAEAEWYAAAARAEAERVAREQAERAANSSNNSGSSGSSSSRARNDNPYDDGGPRIPAGTPGYPRGGCPPGGCTSD